MGKAQKKTKAKPKKNMLELATKVSDRVEIQDVRTIRTQWEVTPSAEKGRQELSFNTSVHVESQEESGHVLVFATFTMNGVPEDSGKREKSFSIEATLLLLYKIGTFEGIEKDNLEAFGEINGVYNAWPYWREFVQSAITRMGLPKLTIPVFRLSGSPEQKKKATKKMTKLSKKRTKKV